MTIKYSDEQTHDAVRGDAAPEADHRQAHDRRQANLDAALQLAAAQQEFVVAGFAPPYELFDIVNLFGEPPLFFCTAAAHPETPSFEQKSYWTQRKTLDLTFFRAKCLFGTALLLADEIIFIERTATARRPNRESGPHRASRRRYLKSPGSAKEALTQ